MSETTHQKSIRLKKVKQNNLKSIDVSIPLEKLTVVTGLSGSGKSSLAFETLYAEGQRRYIESLSTYTRQFLDKMPKPHVEKVENIPPSIALEQRNTILNSRSTVGSQTELDDFLKILMARIGTAFCPNCDVEIQKIEKEYLQNYFIKNYSGKKSLLCAPFSIENAQKKIKKKDSLELFLKSFSSLGFTRVLLKPKSKEEYLFLDLQEDQDDFLKTFKKEPMDLFVVIDRLKIPKTLDDDQKSRILDSISQALQIGHGTIAFFDVDEKKLEFFSDSFSCPSCKTIYPEPEPSLFSSQSPLGACENCNGFGFTLDLDEKLVVPDPHQTLKNGAIDPFSKPSLADWQKDLFRFCEKNKISIGKKYSELTKSQKDLLWKGDEKDKRFPGIYACFEELARYKYKIHIRVFIRRYQSQNLCPVCEGSRLKPYSNSVRLSGKNMLDLSKMPLEDLDAWLKSIKLTESQKKIAHEPYDQIQKRTSLLLEVGVPYLTLGRLAKTLSGGEFQRINLATQLGSGLCGTLYVLDEPSIGLHARDTDRLIQVIQKLRDLGNTVVVVEHDLEMMKAADHILELGPGSGYRGGELMASGSPREVIETKASVTGKYLDGSFQIERPRMPRSPAIRKLKITGCSENNLKNITVEIPLERFVVVSGVSGSGKSTLIHKTLFRELDRLFHRAKDEPGKFDKLYGAEHLKDVVMLDQSPIGRSSRSNPITYLKAYDEIRKIFANQVLSMRRGFTPQHFSFNVDGGRCPVCKGEGEITLDMHFLAEMKLPCEECDGKRFKKNVLEVTYKNKSIYQILETTIDKAYEIFQDNPTLVRKFSVLRDVGLGYLKVGQSSSTLSGGEAQRLKIAGVLDNPDAEKCLYIFDEPTTGLHLEDIKKLLSVLHDLVDNGHSVLLIEHHLDVIKQADYVIDLGPEGGDAGGKLLFSGTPEELAHSKNSLTGQILNAV